MLEQSGPTGCKPSHPRLPWPSGQEIRRILNFRFHSTEGPRSICTFFLSCFLYLLLLFCFITMWTHMKWNSNVTNLDILSVQVKNAGNYCKVCSQWKIQCHCPWPTLLLYVQPVFVWALFCFVFFKNPCSIWSTLCSGACVCIVLMRMWT